ncbi:MAG: hypothetical protein WEB06_02520 [Actinomycetota bacterium]
MPREAGVFAYADRPQERFLLAAIAALLVAGLAAALFIPGGLDLQSAALEAGSLLAPPSDGSFNDAFGRPAAPTIDIPGVSGEVKDPAGGGPSPETPGNNPPPPVPVPEEPPGDEEGLLGFLPDLPILPPPPIVGSFPVRPRWLL